MKKQRAPKVAKTWKALTVRLPAEIHTALKVQVAKEQSSMAEVIERLVRKWLMK